MRTTRRRTKLFLAGGAVVAALALPSAASAVVYCVPNSFHASCQMTSATVAGALNAAQGTNTVADTVRIGTGIFAEDNLTYTTADPANSVAVIGSGTGLTTLTRTETTGFDTVLNLDALAPSSVSDLKLTMIANDAMTDVGLKLVGGINAARVVVDGPADNAQGVQLNGGTSLDEATVALLAPSTTAVKSLGGSKMVSDSELSAGVGVEHGGATLTIERSRIEANFGAQIDQGSLVVRDSVIDLGAANNGVGVQIANFNASNETLAGTVDGTTIVGGGGASIGVYALADANMETTNVAVSNTVIDGPAAPLKVEADDGRTASMTSSYSNYNAGAVVVDSGTGTATLTPSSITGHAPGFTGDFHLLSSSPLIDIGDPAAPGMGATDFDGDPRALDGTFDCSSAARRDIGADEVAGLPGLRDCISPDTFITAKRRTVTRRKRLPINLVFSSNEPGVNYSCTASLTGGAKKADPPIPIAGLEDALCSPWERIARDFGKVLEEIIKRENAKKAQATLEATAIDAAGNKDPSPAGVTVTVRKKKKKRIIVIVPK